MNNEPTKDPIADESALVALFTKHRPSPDRTRTRRITRRVRHYAEGQNLILFGTLTLWRVLLELAAALYVGTAGRRSLSRLR